MTDLLARLRQLAEALPPGGAITVPREWLLAELEAPEAPTDAPFEPDLSAEALAQLFGKRPSTVRGWLEAGLFPGAYKLRGRSWRVPRAAALAFQQRERDGKPLDGSPTPDHATGSLGDWRKARRGAAS